MKSFLFFLLLLLMFLVSGCFSVPRVSGETMIESEKYLVKIPKSYIGNQAMIDYAINQWVKKQGHTSYDIEIQRRGTSFDYYVTMPGSVPVKDLHEIKLFHLERTITAVAVPVGVLSLFLSILMLVFLF